MWQIIVNFVKLYLFAALYWIRTKLGLVKPKTAVRPNYFEAYKSYVDPQKNINNCNKVLNTLQITKPNNLVYYGGLVLDKKEIENTCIDKFDSTSVGYFNEEISKTIQSNKESE